MSGRRTSREIIVFFASAYGISWAIWLPLVLGKSGLGVIPAQVSPLFLYAGFIGPTLAAVITQRILSGNWRAFRLWTSWRQMTMGMLVGSALLLLASFAAAIALTQSGYGLWNWAALLSIPRLFLPNLVGGPLTEEPGWRGFALPRLQARLHPLLASVVLGFLWASWHLPLYLVHFSSIPYWLFVPFLIGAAIVIAFGFNVSGGSSLVAIYLHGLMNVGFGVITNDFLGKATMRQGFTESAIASGSFLAVGVLVALATRGRLGLSLGEDRAHSASAC